MNKILFGLYLLSGSATAGIYTNPDYSNALKLIDNLSSEEVLILERAPSIYEFSSQFVPGRSSVSYTGQAFRHVLNSDLKLFMSQLTRGGYDGLASDAYLALDSFYSYNSQSDIIVPGSIWGYSEFGVTAQGNDGSAMPIFEGQYYEDLQANGKQLRNKTAGNDNPLRRGELKGWSTKVINGFDLGKEDKDKDGIIEPEDLVDVWFKICARNATDTNSFLADLGQGRKQRVDKACITEDGLDLTQLVQKFLHGAVSYSQAARDYLSDELGASKGLNADNSMAVAGKAYSAREHHWDEAFGYFGAARDYLHYDLQAIKSGFSRDTNDDGAIALLSEKNQGLSINAAKRQLGAGGNDVNFVFEAGDAFLKGRYLINIDYNKPSLIKAQAIRALGAWEKTIAATTIHYINETIKEMNEFGTDSYLFTNHAKYWSEMKGFALAFQFSPVSILSDEGFDKLHHLLGDKPVLGGSAQEVKEAYGARLLEARNLLKDTYSFSELSTINW